MAARKAGDGFNQGLAVYIEWGPQQAKPVEQRLARTLPELSAKAIGELIKEYREIVWAAHRAVIDQLETKQPEDVGRQRVSDIDPRLSAANVATLYTQARVSAWRDGYQ
jgi:hypothetical protein